MFRTVFFTFNGEHSQINIYLHACSIMWCCTVCQGLHLPLLFLPYLIIFFVCDSYMYSTFNIDDSTCVWIWTRAITYLMSPLNLIFPFILGKCNKQDACPYIHDPSKVAVCTKWVFSFTFCFNFISWFRCVSILRYMYMYSAGRNYACLHVIWRVL